MTLPPLYEGQIKYKEGDPVILDNQHVWHGQPGQERQRRRRRETSTQRALSRWRQKYPFISPLWLILIGGACFLFAWLLSFD